MHGGILIQHHEIQTVAAQAIVVIGTAQGDGSPSAQFNAQIGLVGLAGPERPRELLQRLPGDALSLAIGRCDIPGESTAFPASLAQLGQSQIGFAEAAASDQYSKAAIAAEDLMLQLAESNVNGRAGFHFSLS